MPEAPETPYLRAAFLTAGVAVVLGLAVSALISVLGRAGIDGSAAGLARTAVRGWLVAQGSGIEVQGTSISLVPLGASVLVAALVAQSAAWICADPVDELGPFAATVAGAHGVAAAILSAVTETSEVRTSVVRAAFGAFAVGGVGAALGASLRHGRTDALWFTDRSDVRAVVRGAGWGVVTLVGSSAVLLTALLVVHLDRAGDLWAMLNPGFWGGVSLAVVTLLAVPTGVLWTVSVLLGPGFALGTDTSVDLTGAQLGQVPGFPLLAALPAPGEFAGWVFVLGLVPLAAGIAAGFRTPYESTDDQALLRRLGLGAAAGAVAGFLVGLAVLLSSGGIGPGRMADAGPPAFTPLLVAVPVLAVGGALGAVLAHYRGGRALGSPRRPRLRWRHQPPSADRRDDVG
ncbi:cell division protein PerM [Aeromicrobium terrae]|uniref:Uncharacterized protein n=1 Tax=Aeromicrobium terrae TaxID=2498846 RepID=A0A5C8NES0_9ACTN|nr:DUF6350 family protein [Aeromicrobium terrae]TXL57269.1 hypothetical protein FHP06_14585 [Aeromicrobium terrae]